jgi:hypothetical protein
MYWCKVFVYYLDYIPYLNFYNHCFNPREGAHKLLVYIYSNTIKCDYDTATSIKTKPETTTSPTLKLTEANC